MISWIMIILYSGTVTVIDFNSLESCKVAQKELVSKAGAYYTYCVQK